MEISKPLKNLQKLLECPICLEIKTQIFLCKLGHNVCDACMLRVDKCPVCLSNFSRIRNYCAESISLMFNNLQKELNDIEKSLKKTDLPVNKKSLTHKFDPFLELGITVNRSWGMFPCILKTCSFEGCFDAIVNHFNNKHPKMFELILDRTLPITKQWSIIYVKQKKTINNCFFIINVGLFVFHININENGYLRCTILMYASRSVAKKISYRFNVTDGKQMWSLKTRKTQTCRTKLDIVYTTCLTISPEEILGNSNTTTVPLTCMVHLKQQILR